MPQSPILVIGGDGQIGRSLVSQFQKAHIDVHWTTRKLVSGKNIHFLDLKEEIVESLLKDIPFKAVYLCAGVGSIKTCAEKPKETSYINVDQSIKLGIIFSKRKIPFWFLSGSAPFDGSIEAPTVSDPVSPVTEYGRQKAMAEQELLKLTSVGVLRVTKVLSSENSLLKSWLESLNKSESIHPFHDLNLSPVSLLELSKVLSFLGSEGKRGLYHLSGDKSVSYLDLAKALVSKFNFDPRLVEPISSTGKDIIPNHCSRLIQNLPGSFKPQTLQQVLSDIYP